MDRGPVDPEGSEEAKGGGDEAAGNGRVPPPRTLGEWGLDLSYSNLRRKEEFRRGNSVLWWVIHEAGSRGGGPEKHEGGREA